MNVDTNKFDIALNDKNDIDLNATKGAFNVIHGEQELAQKVSNLLNINRGEIIWNRQLGLNQRELLLDDGNPSAIQSKVNAYLRQIFGNSYVSCSVKNNRIDRTKRSEYITLNVRMNTQNGPITISPDLMIGGN